MESTDEANSAGNFDRRFGAARRGDLSELGNLLSVYRGYLLSLAARGLSKSLIPKAAPSDLVQETLFEAYRDFSVFKGSTEPELVAWIKQILVHRLLDVHRIYRVSQKRDTKREIPLKDIDERELLLLGDVTKITSPLNHLIVAERLKLLRFAISHLSQTDQDAIKYHTFEQLTFDEVGLKMGRTSDAVRKIWSRAIAKLAKELWSHGSGS